MPGFVVVTANSGRSLVSLRTLTHGSNWRGISSWVFGFWARGVILSCSHSLALAADSASCGNPFARWATTLASVGRAGRS